MKQNNLAILCQCGQIVYIPAESNKNAMSILRPFHTGPKDIGVQYSINRHIGGLKLRYFDLKNPMIF